MILYITHKPQQHWFYSKDSQRWKSTWKRWLWSEALGLPHDSLCPGIPANLPENRSAHISAGGFSNRRRLDGPNLVMHSNPRKDSKTMKSNYINTSIYCHSLRDFHLFVLYLFAGCYNGYLGEQQRLLPGNLFDENNKLVYEPLLLLFHAVSSVRTTQNISKLGKSNSLGSYFSCSGFYLSSLVYEAETHTTEQSCPLAPGSRYDSYWCVLRRECSGMIHWLTINFIIPATPFPVPTHPATLRKTHQ